MANYEILSAILEIKDFVKTLKKNKEVAGFNVHVTKKMGVSCIVAKSFDESKQGLAFLPVHLDWANPYERPLIAGAIHEGLYGKQMSPEESERMMIEKESYNV